MAVWVAEVAPTEAQSDDGETISGRIVAQRLADGRTEFGWEPTGRKIVLPTGRFFPADVDDQSWRSSSPIEVSGAEIGRINARLSEDGRIEFAFTPTDGEQILPPARYFPHDAARERWLRSTEIVLQGPTRAKKKDLLVERLYGLHPGEADTRTNHDQNDWGCNVPSVAEADCSTGQTAETFYNRLVDVASWNAYEGGHGGWDTSHRDRRPTFYSLSEGEVIAAGGGQRAWPCNDIAVYDQDAELTTIYLHADTVAVSVGDFVSVGTPLGTEGTRCRGTVAEHVHVEVRRGRAAIGTGGGGTSRIYARGAGQTPGSSEPADEYSIDPLPYLFNAACGNAPDRLAARDGDGRVSTVCGGMLIRDGASPEVYVVKIKGGKYFRRHVVTAGLYGEVPGWSGDVVQSMTATAFQTIRKSPLVRLSAATARIHGGDTDSIYFVEETGEDAIVLRHIPDSKAFEDAECDWNGVFAMSESEYNYWRTRIGDALDGGRTDGAFRCPQ